METENLDGVVNKKFVEKGGKSLRELVDELERQRAIENKDKIVSTKDLWVAPNSELDNLIMSTPNEANLRINEIAHKQIAEKLKIPQRYYDLLKKQKDPELLNLLVKNINTLLHKQDSKRLVRTLDGRVRAFLSSRYKILDNYSMLSLALEEFRKHNVEIEKSYLTDTRMYVRATIPSLQADIKENDPVRAGISVQNSEVGHGRYKIESYLYRVICQNGAISTQNFSRTHIGRDHQIGEIISQRTVELESATIVSQAKDYIEHVLNPTNFEIWVNALKNSTEVQIDKPAIAVDNIVVEYNLPPTAKDDLLNYFIKEGGSTQYDLGNAITYYAQQNTTTIDDQTDLERIGGDLFLMPENRFTKMVSKPLPT